MSKEIQEESIQDLQDIISGEDEENTEVKVGTPEETEETKEETHEESEEPKEDEEETTEESIKAPEYKEIVAKYPKLFKDFPELKHTFFQNKEYRELFPTVEEAREAHEDVTGLRELENALIDGDEGSVAGVMEAMKELGEDVIPNFALGFLPALQKLDQGVYYNVITPVLISVVRNVYDAGVSNDNENYRNAALLVSQYLFRDQKVASGEKEVKLAERKVKDNKQDNELERERTSFRQERYTALYNDVVQSCDSQLLDIVLDGIDPKDTIPEGVRDLIAEKVVKEISKVLGNSSSHKSRMDSLWKKAAGDKFSTGNKSRIVTAYLEAAREIMPRIRNKIRSNVLGIRERQPESGGRTERREPKSTTGGGQQTRSSGNGDRKSSANPKDIDWRKTSDMDLFNDRVTYKK